VSTGDGYYLDGSFVQHTHHPYTGSYGAVAIADCALLLPWLKETAWECLDPGQTNVIQWVYDSYEPLLYKAAMADYSRGRAISRSSSTDRTTGHGILQSILRLVPWASVADATRMKSLIKGNAQADTVRTFSTNAPLALASDARSLMSDALIAPRPELIGCFAFPAMDRAMHLRPGFGFGISMSSSRIYNYESINGENLHGWFTGDGMTYLYNSDLNQFADAFWPTVNPYRLPGTTTPNTARTDAQNQSALSSKSWVGGATLDGTYGVMGMELDTQGSTLTARKSWFLFDDEIVCLGAGITSTDAGVPIETTVENRKLSTAGNDAFTVNGTAKPATLGWSESLSGVQWCHLANSGGYYFPAAANLQGLREARTGNWSDIGANTGTFTRNYLTLWFSHGAAPSGATYGYVLLPNFTSTQTSAYATAPEVQIVENSSSAQGVRETGLGVLAVNFWNTATKTVDYITSNAKASVIAQQTPLTLIVECSDPTQANAGSVIVTLARHAWSVVSADAGVTAALSSSTTQLTIAMAGRFGRPARAEVMTASPIEQWRYANFGTTASSGSAADTVDADGDGEINLFEFATGQNAQAATKAPITCQRNGAAVEFNYVRSKAAMSDGVTFAVNWSTTLSANAWSGAGVTEQILSVEGTVQTVKATVDATGQPRCFLRLEVSRP
jgi:hyaluronate lyase